MHNSMANPSNDDGHLVDRLSSEPLQVLKLKSTRESVSLLRIGQYQIRSRNKIHLMAKWYYGMKQLNWEILEDGLAKKIAIDWSNISAIRVDYSGDLKILEIELHEPPHFHGEFALRPMKHASWKPISDFTGGQASTYRIHHLEFSDETLLERNMKPLFTLDPRLKESTEKHFPSLGSPFFVDLELRLGRSPCNEMNQVDPGRHLGLASISNPHQDLALGLPSNSSYRLTASHRPGRPPDNERHENRNNEQLAIMTSNDPRTTDDDAHDSHYGPTGAELFSNFHRIRRHR